MGLQAILMECLKMGTSLCMGDSMMGMTPMMHAPQNLFSPHASAFHLTPNGHANVESEHGYLTIDKHQVGSGDGDHDYDGYRGNNAGSNWDECSNNNDNNDNGSSNNGDAPALTCTTSCAVEQSGLDARASKKGPSNSFKGVQSFTDSQGPKHGTACISKTALTQPELDRTGQLLTASFWVNFCEDRSKCGCVVHKDILCGNLAHPKAGHPVLQAAHKAIVIMLWKQMRRILRQKASWAVLEVTEIVDAHGHMKLVAPSLFPYMWERVDEGPDGPIPKGTLQHNCILDTFAFYLESTSVIKPSARENPVHFPQFALTLATIAVERAFWVWSMGQYVPLPKAQQRFSQALWGYATNEVMESVDCLLVKQWKRILLGAEKYVGAYHPQPTLDVLVAKLRKPSGRATCFEPNSK
ncbi:hypothetical protein EDD17DRAFT_1511440 [Pisolithus thermaeus]|nr:hypothetical protein EDD17DRAFT_1511440 [Pisolithus thermaeus]